MAAIIPLLTYMYGIGLTSKVLAVVVLASPVIVMNSYKGIRNANPSLIQMCRAFLGTRRQEIVKIILPHAGALIFAGLRLGVAMGFIGIVIAELLITPTGIGDLITYNSSVADYPNMFAAIVSIIVVAALTIYALERLERGPHDCVGLVGVDARSRLATGEFGGVLPGAHPEYQQIGERIPAETIRAVQAGPHLARRKEPGDR